MKSKIKYIIGKSNDCKNLKNPNIEDGKFDADLENDIEICAHSLLSDGINQRSDLNKCEDEDVTVVRCGAVRCGAERCGNEGIGGGLETSRRGGW